MHNSFCRYHFSNRFPGEIRIIALHFGPSKQTVFVFVSELSAEQAADRSTRQKSQGYFIHVIVDNYMNTSSARFNDSGDNHDTDPDNAQLVTSHNRCVTSQFFRAASPLCTIMRRSITEYFPRRTY